ncbi:MAG TPA: peptide chain release factor 2 [Candidatus Saccharimonadales bacterium]|nr:peptide chain release factor 2 [Candidatus Saccharimonadales bacterium]
MDGLKKRAAELRSAITDASTRLHIEEQTRELEALQAESQQPDFWNDNVHAQTVMKQIAKLDAAVAPWRQLSKDIADVHDMLQLGDDSLQEELATQLDGIEQAFESLKQDLKFTGPYDNYDVIMSLYAGAGGTDAQDWAGMLMRMYIRYAEAHKIKVDVLDESAGDEAGIKSATLRFSGGQHLYGKLKGEHGVHRLVRQSPFNSAASRETSFAKVDILPEIDQPSDLEIDEKDLKIDVYRSGGHGGQSVNTTDSAVRVTHLPTGVTVAIQNERSQLQNKETALTILRSRLAQLQFEQHAEKVSELKGPDSANEFGSQIRNYVLHPYKQVKDLRSGYETSDPDGVLNGNLDPLIDSYLEQQLGGE